MSFNPQKSLWDRYVIINPIFLGWQRVQVTYSHHTASTWEKHNSNPGCLIPECGHLASGAIASLLLFFSNWCYSKSYSWTFILAASYYTVHYLSCFFPLATTKNSQQSLYCTQFQLLSLGRLKEEDSLGQKAWLRLPSIYEKPLFKSATPISTPKMLRFIVPEEIRCWSDINYFYQTYFY